jgi:hypothetical protein
MTTTTSQDPVDQATLDRITFDTYVDCGRNATAAAKQLGCSPSTVTRRVKRHSLVATAADHGARADKAIASAKAVTSDVQDKLDAKHAAKAPAERKPRPRTSGSSVTEGPPPRCPGGGQTGLDGPGSTRCTVCTQDAASVRRDGTLGSHKLLRPRDGAK